MRNVRVLHTETNLPRIVRNIGRRQSDEVRKERGEYIGFEKRLIQFIMYDYLVY